MDGGPIGALRAASGRRGGEGCVFILADGGACGDEPRHGSRYCDRHHALCHLSPGSAAEKRRIREVEALAEAIGGRAGGAGLGPPERLLRRLERVARRFSCRKRSCIVRGEER